MPTTHPMPELQIWPTSGSLKVRWAEKTDNRSIADMHLGPDGVGLGMVIYVLWADLCDAVVQLLGYSSRKVVGAQSLSGSIAAAANTNPISIFTNGLHGLASGQTVTIVGVTGNTAANGTWVVTVTAVDHFTIPVAGNSNYTGGGTWTMNVAGTPQLSRKLPWQHPYWNQLWVKAITSVKGIRMEGTNIADPEDLFFVGEGSVGPGYDVNYGPWTEYRLAEITLAFWRPPYYVRSDADIFDFDQQLQVEWLRYVDKRWQTNTQIISSETSYFTWSGSPNDSKTLPGAGSFAPPTANGQFPGSVGRPVSHSKLTRKWYQIPEQCIFSLIADGTPNGAPLNLLYMRTPGVNPITGYTQDPTVVDGSGNPVGLYYYPITSCVNLPMGNGSYQLTCTWTAGNPVIQVSSTVGVQIGDAFTYKPSVIPTGTVVISINSGAGTVTLNQSPLQSAVGIVATLVSDANVTDRFFGYPMGTLRYDGFELEPIPLQLPPYLMAIPILAANEALSQQQYNVVFHFDYFDPPRPPSSPMGIGFRGHNLVPWAGDVLWHPINSQHAVPNATNAAPTTPFQYADFSDLFTVL